MSVAYSGGSLAGAALGRFSRSSSTTWLCSIWEQSFLGARIGQTAPKFGTDRVQQLGTREVV